MSTKRRLTRSSPDSVRAAHAPQGRPSPIDRSELRDFIAIVGHELRTPLSIICSAAELALKQADDGPPERRVLEVIHRNSELAMLLLRRLTLARDIESGDLGLTLTDVDLGQLVADSVDDLRPLVLAEHPVAVQISTSLTIPADATAVREIMFNLLSNAAKYSHEHAAIEVTVTADRRCAHVVIRNHGSGVTPGDSDTIFDKFYQSDPAASGAGLGLYICRGLARAHGGELSVQPAADVGSEFRLSLPLS